MFDKMTVRSLISVASRPTMISLALLSTVATVARADTITLTTPGDGGVTVPTGQQWIDVEVQCWGGGGGGGGDYGTYAGGGGGGGAYAYNTYPALLSGSYSYYIGAGGGAGAIESNGSGGGNTIWNFGGPQDIYVTGGGGGYYGGNGGSSGLVLAGTGSQGGDGGSPANYGGGGGGGSAGPSGPGGSGGNGGRSEYYGGNGGAGYGAGGVGGGGDSGPSGLGSFPGGGGGSAYYFQTYAGSPGSNGEIIVTYTAESVPEPNTLALLVAGGACLIAYRWRKRVARRTPRPGQERDDRATLSFPSNAFHQPDFARRAA